MIPDAAAKVNPGLRVPLQNAAEPVGAVVVTYHPEPDVAAHLAALSEQVTNLVVVDNGSDPAAVAMLQTASAQLGFELILNGENLGIATALNIGAHRALLLGSAWLLLFDQDSCITTSFTENMLRCYAQHSETQRVGILVPRYIDSRTQQPLPQVTLPDRTLATAMTSGTLLAAHTFKTCGDFADELFIDNVDHDYSLRIRRAGYIIAVCDFAVLLHSPGTPLHHSLLGLIPFQSTNYSPLRRYYQERNKIWMYRRHLSAFPAFCSREALRSLVDLLKILLAESNKLEKFRCAFRGVADGLRGRMGRL